MEHEYKWKFLFEAAMKEILADAFVRMAIVSGPEKIQMKASYYDSEDGFLSNKMHAALRLRSENGKKICCLKIPKGGEGACRIREEYEIPAESISEGISRLPSAGADEQICRLLASMKMQKICSTDFVRRSYSLKTERFSAELSFDSGFAIKGDKKAEIRDIELEFKEGSEAEFHAWAALLSDKHSLKEEKLSKFAQAMSL